MILGTFQNLILFLAVGVVLISSSPQILTGDPYGRSFNNGYGGGGLNGYGPGGLNGYGGGFGGLNGGLGQGILGGGIGLGYGGLGINSGLNNGGFGGLGNQGYGYWSDASSNRFTSTSNTVHSVLFLSTAVTAFLTLLL